MAKKVDIRNRIKELRYITAAELDPHPLQHRVHPDKQKKALEAALREIGITGAMLAYETPDGIRLIDGHGRREVAPDTTWPVLILDVNDAEARQILAQHDALAGLAEVDAGALDALLREVSSGEAALQELFAEMAADAGLYDQPGGDDSEAAAQEQAEPRKTLAERFGVPPFSVLDARQGYWQERKRAWIALGIQSELGRGDNATATNDSGVGGGMCERLAPRNGLLGESEQARSHYKMKGNPNGAEDGKGGLKIDDTRRSSRASAAPGGSLRPAMTLGKDGKTVRGDGAGRPMQRLTWVAGDRPEDELDDVSRKILAAQPQSGTSIFDPVLCELVYRWFCPDGGSILDPFAGGSVRGIVAAKLGRQYTGIDLRPEQITANREQAQAMGLDVAWVVGDSRNVQQLAPGAYDLVFSCPPYADLEVYSDNPQDLSTLE